MCESCKCVHLLFSLSMPFGTSVMTEEKKQDSCKEDAETGRWQMCESCKCVHLMFSLFLPLGTSVTSENIEHYIRLHMYVKQIYVQKHAYGNCVKAPNEYIYCSHSPCHLAPVWRLRKKNLDTCKEYAETDTHMALV